MGEGRGSLPDQHGEAIDGGKSRRARPGQEWRIDRIGHDVIGDRTRRRMTPVECQRRLSAHSERRGIDDQIAASFAVVESEIAWPGEVVERRDMVVARGIDLVEQCARLVGVAARQHQSEAFLRQPGHDRTCRAARAQYPRHAEIVPVAQSFGEESGIPWPLLVAGLSLPFIGALTSLVLFAVYPSKTRELILWFAKLLPRRFEETLDSLIETFLLGLSPLRSMKMLVTLFLLSIPIWITEAAVFFLIGLPFGFVGLHSGPGAMAVTMVLVTAITNIGSSIPAAPGGLGLFEIIARETLALGPLVSVDRSVAAAFAVVVHAVILLPMIILGQVILWTGHISLGRLSREGQRDTAQTP